MKKLLSVFTLLLFAFGFSQDWNLKLNGAEVNIGENIKKGQFIGYSGDTGWTNGPHLHLSVYLNRMDGDRKYLPTYFKTSNDAAVLLEEKKFYTSDY